MTAVVDEAPPVASSVASSGLSPAVAALRLRFALALALFALAAIGWWWTAGEMRGMDMGPWTGLGSLGWFVGVWLVMMAAMMLPSVAPTVALYARMTRQRSPISPLAFTTGYLLIWTAAGVVAFALAAGASELAGDWFAWDRAGKELAGATLIAAAVYEITPLKNACLGKCRSPLGFLLGSWRDGPRGAVGMGARLGLWCLGCCWALMASLFALGVMSITWMAIVAGIIAVEKALPWRRVATFGVAAALLAVGLLLWVSPSSVPGLTVPASDPAPMTPDGM
jgi:predicted metal-binding membrane protein